MTTKKFPNNFLRLPVELVYRICDFLDAETILSSFRCVCKQFYHIANTYNQYKIYSQSTFKKIIICQMIHLENIILLDLIEDSIDFFLLCFVKQQFTRLRSLSLCQMTNDQLHTVLKHIPKYSHLTSFSIQSNLPNDDTFLWPVECNLKKISFHNCTFKQFYSILQNSRYIQSLTVNDCSINNIDLNLRLNVYHHLTSLTFNDLRIIMDKLEFLLQLVPSLVHLNLTSSGKPFEFIRRLSQWEEFISTYLPYLRQLEFHIFCFQFDWEYFDSLISSFRSPFWLVEKHWFVTCQFRDDWSSSFTIFTTTMNSTDGFYQRPRISDEIQLN